MILHGDSVEVLKDIESESVDLVCTDPPYGYSFMGKAWDKALPDIEIFKECYRVLKPGAFAFVMSAPRSDVCSRMAILLEDAGFNIAFTPIYWTYASGFPKAMNIGKMVDKRSGEVEFPKNTPIGGNTSMTGANYTRHAAPPRTTDAAKALDGSYGGFQPKPAVEVVIVAMKPLSEKTYVDQALKNGKGITWLDDARIPTKENLSTGFYPGEDAMGNAKGDSIQGERQSVPNTNGRFPANLLVSDDVLNDGNIQKSNFATGGNSKENQLFGYGNDRGDTPRGFGDTGGYSRFFSLDAWAQNLPFLQVPKASKSEKNKGLDEFEERNKEILRQNKTNVHKSLKTGSGNERSTMFKNHHPTVKPLTLMSYLITLGSRPEDTVLDPFCGSGTTVLAAKQLGRNGIGIEREQEYVDIAEARLQAIIPTLL